MEDLVDFIDLMDKDPSQQKSNCIFNIENRQVLKTKSIGNVHKNIEFYMKLYPGKALPKTYEELIVMNESGRGLDINAPIKNNVQVLYSGKEGKLIVPLTQETSCKYGKGTKWCTAAEIYKNQFESYNKDDRLYIWIQKPGKRKYQFYFPSAEFKDALNNEITNELFSYFRNENPITKELFHIKELEMIDRFTQGEIDEGFVDYLKNLNFQWPELFEKIQNDGKSMKRLFGIFKRIVNSGYNEITNMMSPQEAKGVNIAQELKIEEILREYNFSKFVDQDRLDEVFSEIDEIYDRVSE